MSNADERKKESEAVLKKFKEYIYSNTFLMTEAEYWRKKYYGEI